MSKETLVGGKKGRLFILSAPAGTGKTTLVRKLTEEFPHVKESINFTSRKPRENEVDGVDYHFVSKEEFEKKIEEDSLLEHVKLYETYYGTDKEWISGELEKGNHVILVIDTQGALHLKGKVDAEFIFVYPPSFEELERRLRSRQTETEASIEERLTWSKREVEAGRYYDYHIVNDNFDVAYEILRSIVIAADHKGVSDEI